MTMNLEVGGFTFISDFDSGNLGHVELVIKKQNEETTETEKSSLSDDDVPDFEFNMWTRPDCVGSEYENGNRTWFYFGIKGGMPCANIQLNIVDLNKQTKMYSQGMAPVYRVVPGRNHWERIKDKPHFRVRDNVFILTFKYKTPENPRATTYFAFTYPYPYADLQNMLQNMDNRFKHQEEDVRKRNVDLDDIYYHRECVCYSLEGRRIDLITISSHHYITEEREPRLKFLFPDTERPRPFSFTQKKVVFVSARVHPGETPSSFVLNGLLSLLLKRDDPIAILLRKNYVFKLIPMLNPDGVFKGHYRTDTRGVNLNRVYLSPSFALHPPIYAARSLILYYHHGQEIEDVVTGPVFDPVSRRLKPRPSLIVTESDSVEMPDTATPVSDLLCTNNNKNVNSVNQSDLKKTSSIENQVSCLTLDDTSAVLPDDNSSIAGDMSGMTSSQTDVLSVICESFIRKVFDVNELDKNPTVSVVAGGLYNEPLIIETRPQGVKSSPVVNSPPETENEDRNVASGVRSETSLSVGSLQSSGSSGGYVHRNSLYSETLNEKQQCGRRGRSLSPKKLNWNYSTCSETLCAENERKTVCTSPENSGLFLYIDLHGHASKKGIFMYGNHFDNLADSVECMLLPKIMSLNSPNFHFSACNFTERNMYLRDRKDGSSREGCGRVSVLKATGLVRSYTLECNYNTGRIVNVLPPCVRDAHKPSSTILVPPKYNPHVFEEIGQALGASILDLTGTHPWSRIPNSEFRTLNGIREWLKSNCVPEQICMQKSLQQNNRHLNSRRQVVCLAGASVRMSRPARATASSCKASRHETKRRLAPLTSKAAKVAGCSNISIHDSTSKSEDNASTSMIDIDRKENVTSFQIISPPQSPERMKLNKSTSDPKENISPSSSLKISSTTKKLKGVSGVGVLKQVLVVRAKCTSVSSVSGNSKVRSNNSLKINKTPTVSGNNLQKNYKVPYNHLVKCVSSDVQMSGDSTASEGSNSSGTQSIVDQSDVTCSHDTVIVEKSIANEKTKYIKDESKGIVKHGPKRLKVSSFKTDPQSAIAHQNGPNKLTLKEICYLNLCKQKKNISKFAVLTESVLGNHVASSSAENALWSNEHHAEVVSLRATRQNSLLSKNKLIHKNMIANSVSKCPVSSIKSVKTSMPGPSSNIKVKTNCKSDKLLKSKVPHLSPMKTLKKSPSIGRKISTEGGKKWGKASLKNFATSVGKLRVAVKEDTVCIEKKRKKSKVKR